MSSGESQVVATVSITRREGRGAVDREVQVSSLNELFELCKDAPPSDVVRIALRGPDGVVTLNFASFRHKP